MLECIIFFQHKTILEDTISGDLVSIKTNVYEDCIDTLTFTSSNL